MKLRIPLLYILRGNDLFYFHTIYFHFLTISFCFTTILFYFLIIHVLSLVFRNYFLFCFRRRGVQSAFFPMRALRSLLLPWFFAHKHAGNPSQHAQYHIQSHEGENKYD